MPDLMQPADWRPLLSGVHRVIHLAGIAHRAASDQEHDRGNHRAAGEIAKAAAQQGVAQFVFVSSIAAQSAASADHVLRETDTPKPDSPYGTAKLAGEKAVRACGVPVTILRPVVVDGDGAKGNVALIHRIARLPLPLPFGLLRNRRSILSVDNFNQAILTVISNPAALGETYVVADPHPLTIGEIVADIRRDMGRSPGLLNVPPSLLEGTVALFGQRALCNRLGGSLAVSPEKLLALGWKPITREQRLINRAILD